MNECLINYVNLEIGYEIFHKQHCIYSVTS